MIKLLIASLLSISAGACLADSFDCPPSVICMESDNISSCKINGDSAIFHNISTPDGGANQADIYNFAFADHDDSSNTSTCHYRSTHPVGYALTVSAHNASIIPDLSRSGTAWKSYADNLPFQVCLNQVSSNHDCPFIFSSNFKK